VNGFQIANALLLVTADSARFAAESVNRAARTTPFLLSITSKITRLKWALALATVLVAFVALPAFASATTYSMKWSRSALLENPKKGGALSSISCAPASTAVKNAPLMCVAGDTHGSIWASEHPSQPVKGWHRANVDTGANGGVITGVACPATNLCVAVDSVGQVTHSTQPTGGKADWTKPIRVDTATQAGGGYAGLAAISCPTINLCVAVDNSANGQVAYTTDPRGPASAWKLVTIGTSVTLSSVSCASATLCVIGGTQRYYSVTPTGAATTWKPTGGISGSSAVISSLACNTVKLCIGVGYGNAGAGLVAASSAPSGDSTAWPITAVGSNPPNQSAGLLDSVACPQRNFCVAVDGSSNAYSTTTPVRGGWTKAKPLKKASQSSLSAVSCNAKLCVEVDNRGTVTYGVVKGAGAPTKTTTTSTTTTTTPTTTTKTSTTG
jgi:hypothetical protein